MIENIQICSLKLIQIRTSFRINKNLQKIKRMLGMQIRNKKARKWVRRKVRNYLFKQVQRQEQNRRAAHLKSRRFLALNVVNRHHLSLLLNRKKKISRHRKNKNLRKREKKSHQNQTPLICL